MYEINKEGINSKLLSMIPSEILFKLAHIKIFVPCWHAISDKDIEHISPQMKIKTVKSFLTDLDYILFHYTPINIDDLLDYIYGNKLLPKKPFLPTFDDGFKEVYENIAPILIKKGVHAIFFVVTSYVDNKSLGYRQKMNLILRKISRGIAKSKLDKILSILNLNNIPGIDVFSKINNIEYKKRDLLDQLAEIIELDFEEYIKLTRPYLTSSQIKDLIKMGFEIGSHSIDHPRFQELSLDEQLCQIKDSISWLSVNFKYNCRLFAFPFGFESVSSNLLDNIFKDTGIKVTMNFHRGHIYNNPKSIPRIPMEMTSLPARALLSYEFAKALFYKYRLLI